MKVDAIAVVNFACWSEGLGVVCGGKERKFEGEVKATSFEVGSNNAGGDVLINPSVISRMSAISRSMRSALSDSRTTREV